MASPTDLARTHLDIGAARLMLGEFVEARHHDESVVAAGGGRATARLARARGDHDIARAYYERAVEAFEAGSFRHLADVTRAEADTGPVA